MVSFIFVDHKTFFLSHSTKWNVFRTSHPVDRIIVYAYPRISEIYQIYQNRQYEETTILNIKHRRHICGVHVFLFYCKQVILMLIVIVIFFFLCWGPILLNNLLVALNVLDKLNTGFLKPMRMAFHLLSYSNSCVNPIVYGIMSHNFRDRLRRTLSRTTSTRSLTATSAFQSRTSFMRRQQNSNYSKTRL